MISIGTADPQSGPAGSAGAAARDSTLILFAVTCGLAVANIYYAQPMLDEIADEFRISHAAVGVVITITQVGYALGLLFLVPLGDLVRRRPLIIAQSLAMSAALVSVAAAPSAAFLFFGLGAVGLLAVITQLLVAYGATLAHPERRGRAVGIVTSGVIIGILAARTVAGLLSDLAGWRSVYLASAAATLAVLFLLVKQLPKNEESATAIGYAKLIGSVFSLFRAVPTLRIRATLALLIFASITALWTPMVLPLSVPPYSLSNSEVGLFGLAGVVGALGAARAGRIADRGGAEVTTASGLVAMLMSWLPIALLDQSLIALAVGVIIIDYGLQSVHVTNQSLITAERPEARSRLIAGYMIFYSIGCAIGSILSTLAYAYAGWFGVCLTGGSFSAAALIYWAATRGRTQEPATHLGSVS